MASAQDDHVPDTLAGDAVILRDLSQGQVLIIVQVEKFLLPRGQDLAVKIEQHRHAIGLIFHVDPSSVKFRCFTTETIIQDFAQNVKAKFGA